MKKEELNKEFMEGVKFLMEMELTYDEALIHLAKSPKWHDKCPKEVMRDVRIYEALNKRPGRLREQLKVLH